MTEKKMEVKMKEHSNKESKEENIGNESHSV